MLAGVKTAAANVVTRPPYSVHRAFRERRDLLVCASFVLDRARALSLAQRLRIVKQLYITSFNLDSPHRQEEILTFMDTILALPKTSPGVVVEAGSYKGSSTAKFSLAAAFANRQLVVFDSFQGIPANDEPHDKNIFGRPECFKEGAYRGTLDEVKHNVSRFGRIDCCRFIPGWFEETLPRFSEPIAAIYLDVDLASSTRTCLKYLYPLLTPGGVLYSQDGHLPLVIDVLSDEDFWLREIGCPRPRIAGLGKQKLVSMTKERHSATR